MPFVVLTFLAFLSVPPETVVLSGKTMGTTYHIKYVVGPSAPSSEKMHNEIKKLLSDVDRQMSTYRPDSELSRFNRAAAGEWFSVSSSIAEVVAAAEQISRNTDGAMDVTVGPLVNLWHFGVTDSKSSQQKHSFVPPSESAISKARKQVGYSKLDVRKDPPALRKQVDGLQVDLSSIASGYTIDWIAKLLGKRGLQNYMIEIGGEIRAYGKRADSTPWRVAVERPVVGAREMEVAIPLVDASIATAGGTRKFFEYRGRRYSHIIDPSTGKPVEHSLASVTVVSSSCIAADGWDTPLLVLGLERGLECAERNHIAAMFISEGPQGRVQTTSEWRKRFGQKSPAR